MTKLLTHDHPLAFLRDSLGLGAEPYLRRVAKRHAALGYGTMATRREKVSRWENGTAVPELTAQLAMADLHRVPPEAVHTLGWPDWLLLTLDNRTAIDLPWTQSGMLHALADTARGGLLMDRRGFLIATGATLTGAADHWFNSLGHPAPEPSGGRMRVNQQMVDRIEQRLDDLRRMDDTLGSGTLRPLAAEELRFAARLLDDAQYTEDIGRRLHSAVAEACRINGWLAFDAGQHAAAQRYYLTALRAAASADDHATGANTLAFMAIQVYSVGRPAEAVDLVQTAQSAVARTATPRVQAMLNARLARAYAKAGQQTDCAHALSAAYAALDRGPHDDDPAWSYWFSPGELENLAGSCALDLGDPQRALRHFDAALATAYGQSDYQRDHALFLTRAAEAHLAQDDVDHAVGRATEAVALLGGVASARSSGSLDSLCAQLARRRTSDTARDFLNSYAG
ncbi:transcriptional regulator [Kitasatospora purpeofusca]|uniref:transcriptional regulator n=1 Tax=Kitasatospora purpeofusca TaxID=67352 RepID=UPI002E10E556|nr:transcriptional regulator [Kitasatospora purpeofusca]